MDLIQVYVKYDLYELLELKMSVETTLLDIKKKYKKLAIKFHPDKYLNSEELSNEEKKTLQSHFNIIGVAYDILSNDTTRNAYDKARKEYLDAGQFGDLKKQFGDFLGKSKTESTKLEPTKLEFNYGDEKTSKNVFKEENMKLNTDNEKIAEEIREKIKKNLNTSYDINKVENLNELLATSNDKNEYMSKFNNLFDTFRQKKSKNSEIVSYNQENSNASIEEAFGLIKLTEPSGISKFEEAFNLMDISEKDYIDNKSSLEERMSAYNNDFELLKIPKLKKREE